MSPENRKKKHFKTGLASKCSFRAIHMIIRFSFTAKQNLIYFDNTKFYLLLSIMTNIVNSVPFLVNILAPICSTTIFLV